jgi:hypothetical protein
MAHDPFEDFDRAAILSVLFFALLMFAGLLVLDAIFG